MAGPAALLVRRAEAGIISRDREIEPNIHVAVHVEWVGATNDRRRMTRRARKPSRANRSGIDVLRVREIDLLFGEETAVARRVRDAPASVTGRARGGEVGLCMAARAGGRVLGSEDDAVRASPRTFVATGARIAIVRVEEGRVLAGA